MIQIYICEDNQKQLELFSRHVNNYLSFHALAQKLVCAAASPHVLLTRLETEKEKGTGLYFLDIDLQSDMNGLELAQHIRTMDPRGYIVFITTHGEMAAETFAYKVEAMDFILKDEPENIRDRIYQCMEMASCREQSLKEQTKSVIRFKTEYFFMTLDQNDLIAVQSGDAPHRLELHTTHGIQQITASLKELESLLDSRFFRCHKSILINLDHMVSYDLKQRTLLMDNQNVYPVSARMSRSLKSKIRS